MQSPLSLRVAKMLYPSMGQFQQKKEERMCISMGRNEMYIFSKKNNKKMTAL